VEREGQIFQADLLVGRGVFLGVSHAPAARGGGARALPNISGSLLFLRTLFDAELSNLTSSDLDVWGWNLF